MWKGEDRTCGKVSNDAQRNLEEAGEVCTHSDSKVWCGGKR